MASSARLPHPPAAPPASGRPAARTGNGLAGGTARTVALPRALLLAAALALALPAAPARAGLLLPVLQLMRPQLENRLARVCVEAAAGSSVDLQRSLEDPCRKLAVPTSKCLIEETDSTGRGLGVLTEMLGGRFGDDSEVVVKRCLARLFGLPADSLREVPLRELGRRFGSRSVPGSPP